MANLLVRILNGFSYFCYIAGHSRLVKVGVLGVLAIAFASMVAIRSARSEDLTIYPLPASHIRSTVANHYVRTTGNILSNGAYEIKSTIAGVIATSLRFIPFLPNDSSDPVLLIDENLPVVTSDMAPVTLVGKFLRGENELPDYYIKVTDPPSLLVYDILGWMSVILLAGVLVGGVLYTLVRRVDYAITVPFTAVESTLPKTDIGTVTPSFLLWFGSLGAAYGDVILREIPVSFKAIPAEAKLIPAYDRDAWTVIIHRTRSVSLATVATSHGALPAIRLEFDDERGITRDGLIAGSDRSVIDSILNVLRFVGQ